MGAITGALTMRLAVCTLLLASVGDVVTTAVGWRIASLTEAAPVSAALGQVRWLLMKVLLAVTVLLLYRIVRHRVTQQGLWMYIVAVISLCALVGVAIVANNIFQIAHAIA